mgnify:FL=1
MLTGARMEILYLMIPLSLLAVVAIAAAFCWAVFSGQYDDTDQAAQAVLEDDDGPGR